MAQYCHDRGDDPFEASPACVANVLKHIAETRAPSVSNMAGYRTEIGHVLCLVTGFDPGTCPIIAQLMQNFKRKQQL